MNNIIMKNCSERSRLLHVGYSIYICGDVALLNDRLTRVINRVFNEACVKIKSTDDGQTKMI